VFRTFIHLITLPFLPDRKLYLQLRRLTGFFPGNLKLYKIAFRHRSASSFDSGGARINNERLEYLGDAILDAIIADYLYQQFPGNDEGYLTQLRSKIVKRKQLNNLGYNLGIGPFIISNTRNSQNKVNILGNTLEALIGAIYLDKGYYCTRKFVIHKVLNKHLDINRLSRKESDFKSRVIEWAQKNKMDIQFISTESPDHPNEPFFISSILMMDEELGSGSGYSKKDAEQMAAEEALEKLDQYQGPFA
jgi:ribonuclease-3